MGSKTTVKFGVVALSVALFWISPTEAQNFIRGDANGDGTIVVADTITILNYLTGLGPCPVDSSGSPLLDSADTNDNEWITLADVIFLNDMLFCGATTPIPPPALPGAPGPDPTPIAQKGFNVVDVTYGASASANVTATTVDVALQITIPAASSAEGASLVLEFSPLLTPASGAPGTPAAFFTPAAGVANLGNIVSGNRVMMSVGGAACGPLPAVSPIPLGTVHFTHAGCVNCAPTPVRLVPDMMTAGGIVLRATVVDGVYDDHHPQLSATTCTQPGTSFIRGDTNADGTVVVADSIYLLNYFLTGGPCPLDSAGLPLIDSGDVNDNEWITYADVALLLDSLYCAATIPPPGAPGFDPTPTNQKGFNVVNPAYVASANASVTATTVDVALQITIPLATVSEGASLILEFSPLLTPVPAGAFFTPAAGIVYNGNLVIGNRVMITVDGQACTPLPAGPTIPLGTAHFTHAGWVNCAPAPVRLVPDMTSAAGLIYRATVVDGVYDDHHPQLTPPPCTQVGSNFSRGDTNFDGVLNNADVVVLVSYFFGLTPGPRDCAGAPQLDAADLNDNEWITYADIAFLSDWLFCGGTPPIPPPTTPACPVGGPDPTTGQGGFNMVDLNYRAYATVNAAPTALNVVLEISIPPATRAQAATLVVEFSPALTPAAGPPGTLFTPGAKVASKGSAVFGNRVVVTAAGNPSCNLLPPPNASSGRIHLGSVNFTHSGCVTCVPMPVKLVPDAMTPGGLIYRATVVDQVYADHHPQLEPRRCMMFIRGDCNGDNVHDISDAICILSWLFASGPAMCINANDANDVGGTDIGDGIYMLQYLFKNGPPPPAPFVAPPGPPLCGPDPTPVPLPCAFYPCP